jgi:NADH-quinone oxidoreductase subunit I/electron transport complex protein RnfC
MAVETERSKVYVVERGTTKLQSGQGLSAGLGVVIKHFRDAFTKKLDNPRETSGVFTVQYPEERLPIAQAYRNFPILLYEETTGQELCTSCFQCQRICPPQVIHMTQAKDPTTGKPVPAVTEFVLEYDACMSCGLCAEVCPFDAIKMDHEFELSTEQHGQLTIDKAGLNRPISYYEKLAPSFWGEVKDTALKKLQGNIKRRPGTAGIAPQMIGKVPANPITEPAKPATDSRQATTNQQRAANTATSVPAAPASAEDKAARLAAIRAKNAAKVVDDQHATTDDRQPTTSADATAPAAPASAEDKAARLAAIRAKNAAKKETEQASEQPISTPDTPAVPLPDDKKARLEAIRAANAAKKAAETSEEPTTPTVIEAAPPADDKQARLAAIRAANAAKKAQQNNE